MPREPHQAPSSFRGLLAWRYAATQKKEADR